VLRDWLALVRAPLAATAAFDAVACCAFARAAAGLSPFRALPEDWALLAATSLLLYGAGMAGNDWADRRRDALLAPTRPIPSGRIRPGAAAAWAFGAAAAAVLLGGGDLGSRLAVAAAVVLAGLYDLVPASRGLSGAPWMGGVRCANASVGVWPLVAAGAAPAWALLPPLAIGLYSAGVTVLSTAEEGGGSATRLLGARVLAAAAFAMAAGVAWLLPIVPSLGTVFGTLVAANVAVSALAGRTPRPGAVKVQVREMLLGLYFLAFVVAAAAGGDDPWLVGGAFAAAFAAIWASQRMMRWLARPTAPPAGG
jgi:4-hydroxybenzoate polyprenyltransferase